MNRTIYIQNGVLAISSRFKPIIQFVKSIRVQVFGALVLIALLIMAVFAEMLLSAYDEKAYSQRVSELQSYGTVIANKIISGGFLSTASVSEADSEILSL